MSVDTDGNKSTPGIESPLSILGYRIAVQEAKVHLDHKYQSVAAHKAFGKIVFAASRLVISLIAVLQVFSASPAAMPGSSRCAEYDCLFVLFAAAPGSPGMSSITYHSTEPDAPQTVPLTDAMFGGQVRIDSSPAAMD